MNYKALFHDMTLDYLRPLEPEAGNKVNIIFRTKEDDALKVTLVYGDKHMQMTKAETDNGFDYYSICVDATEETVYYHFEIESDTESCLFDKRGAVTDILDKMRFCLIPGFATPDWAKGAVMYQIFVDRFCNGDKTNDVLTDEYSYLDGHSELVEDWNRPPAVTGDYRQFYGGDLQGVLDKMDYLEDLGIDVIYFNPLFVSPSSHKYDTQDYDHIDPHFGKIITDNGELLAQGSDDNSKATRYINRVTSKENLTASDELFIKVVQEAHKRGIRVILDGVFNHCGSFNKWLDKERIYENADGYEKGAYVDKNSSYHNYFAFSEDKWPYNNSYDGWWGYDTLPKLNYEGSRELTDYIIEIGRKWVSAPFYVDGWRLDVAADLGHSAEFNHGFWKRFRKAVKEANPEAIILAENYGDSKAWLSGGEWDTVMNYDAFMEPITWFLTGMDKHSDEFRPELWGNADYFWNEMLYRSGENFNTPSLYVAMNELSNHDHSRFLTRTNHTAGRISDHGSEMASQNINKAVMREAVVMQMTWMGAPTIYYGDEAGVCGFTDPDNRRTYPWGNEDQQMIDFHKAIIGIHKLGNEFKTGSVKRLLGEKNVIAYGRFNRLAASVIALNNNTYSVTKEIEVWQLGIPEGAILNRLIETGIKGYDTNSYEIRVKDGKITITLPALSSVVFRYDSENELSREDFWANNTFEF